MSKSRTLLDSESAESADGVDVPTLVYRSTHSPMFFVVAFVRICNARVSISHGHFSSFSNNILASSQCNSSEENRLDDYFIESVCS